MIIAVDGPAASGKGTVARALAAHFRLPYLDTGSLYRAVGLAVLLSGHDPAEDETATMIARHFHHDLLAHPDLRAAATAQAASIVSAHPAVRAALLDRQRAFAGQDGGAVLDGRDIGTVIVPHADAKLFVTADAEIRARRRSAELARAGHPLPDEVVLGDILARDARDSGRHAAPLLQAKDAVLLDTSGLGIEAAVARAIALVEARVPGR